MADITVTASAVKPANARTRIEEGTAGASISAGQAIYADPIDSYKLKPAVSTTQTQAENVVGIALNTVAADQPLDYVVQGDVTFNSALTAGTVYVLGGAAGGISPSADLTGGRYGTILGIADSATNLRVGVVSSGVNSGGAWTPASLASLWAWYKSDSGLWQDTSGTTAATNSSNVARWDDASGNARHLLQATGGLQPVLATNVLNGYPSVNFASDWLRAAVGGAPSTDYSLFIVMKLGTTTDEVFVHCGKYMFYQLTDMMIVGHYWEGEIAKFYNGSVGTSWHLQTAVVDDTGDSTPDGSLYMDGTLQHSDGTTTQGQSVQSSITVGASWQSDWLVPAMDVAEIIITNSAVNSTERQQVHDYIETRYGLTIA
jgi:hypothetical protein